MKPACAAAEHARAGSSPLPLTMAAGQLRPANGHVREVVAQRLIMLPQDSRTEHGGRAACPSNSGVGRAPFKWGAMASSRSYLLPCWPLPDSRQLTDQLQRFARAGAEHASRGLLPWLYTTACRLPPANTLLAACVGRVFTFRRARWLAADRTPLTRFPSFPPGEGCPLADCRQLTDHH